MSPTTQTCQTLKQFFESLYITDFLPTLAKHTTQLTPLTTKDAEKVWPAWTTAHDHAFKAIK